MIKEIYLAGGCFWGMQKYLSLIEGVLETEVGYANGETIDPTYEQVCTGRTGHAEAVRVRYDGGRCDLAFLLSLYFEAIDPTALNRQGGDVGTQYRTGIYYPDPADGARIRAFVDARRPDYPAPIAVEVAPLTAFFPAEAYHQRYLDKNPGGYCHIGRAQFDRARGARMRFRRRDGAALRRELSDMAWRVTQEAGTEPPFSSPLDREFGRGLYVDVTSGEPLFSSADKFEAHCGWPAFAKPVDGGALVERDDLGHGMVRTEVRSRTGDAHLGHVFDDGPARTGGLRYCINGAALRFVPEADMEREGYGEYLSRL